jgi:hypothetical protein
VAPDAIADDPIMMPGLMPGINVSDASLEGKA